MPEIIKSSRLAELIAMVVIALMAMGAIFVYSAGTSLTQDIDLNNFYTAQGFRQCLFFPIALMIMWGMSFFDYRRFSLQGDWKRSVLPYLLIISVVLLVLVLVPHIGVVRNNARRWLELPLGAMRMSFQPSELAKWAVVFFLAAYCDRFSDSLAIFWKRFIPLCLVVGLIAGLILKEDFGTAALVAVVTFSILCASSVKLWYILAPLPLGVAGFLAAILTSDMRKQRILAFLHPDMWADSVNYQPNQSLIALASGGIFGKGLGMGICKYGHLPEDTTDFIFAIIGEELGFVGVAFIILMFIVFIGLGIIVIRRCGDRFGRFLAGGILLVIAIQVVLNIGVVTVVLPTKGIPLPFVSSGGTSLLLSAAAVGVLMNIARQGSQMDGRAVT